MTTIQVLLSEILEAIDYQKDKQAFIESFSSTINQETTLELLDKIPDDTYQKFATEQTVSELNSELVSVLINEHFSKDEIKETQLQVLDQALGDFLAKLKGSLTDQQKAKVATILSSYFSPQA